MAKIIDPDSCPECGGSGKYVGLFEQDDCRACGGAGKLNQQITASLGAPTRGMSYYQAAGRNCRLIGINEVKQKLFPNFARFDFKAICHKQISNTNAYWCYLFDRAHYSNVWLTWDSSNRTQVKAMQYFLSSSAYAIYRKIKSGTPEEDYEDAVFELVKAKP